MGRVDRRNFEPLCVALCSPNYFPPPFTSILKRKLLCEFEIETPHNLGPRKLVPLPSHVTDPVNGTEQ